MISPSFDLVTRDSLDFRTFLANARTNLLTRRARLRGVPETQFPLKPGTKHQFLMRRGATNRAEQACSRANRRRLVA